MTKKRSVALLLLLVMMLNPIVGVAQSLAPPSSEAEKSTDTSIDKTQADHAETQNDPKPVGEKTIEDDANTSTPPKNPTIENEIPADENLGSEDDVRPKNRPNGGGTSGGGGGGGTSIPKLTLPANDRVVVRKTDDDGKPMSVAFRITNTATGETHLAITDDEGCSGTIHLAPVSKMKILEAKSVFHFDAYIAKKKMRQLTDKDLQEHVEAPDGVFGPPEGIPSNPPHQSISTGPNVYNEIDAYKDASQEKNVYDQFSQLKKGGEVKFTKTSENYGHLRGHIKLELHFGAVHPSGRKGPFTDEDRERAGDPTQYREHEEYPYPNRNSSDMQMIRMETVWSFAEKRAAALMKQKKLTTDEGQILITVNFYPDEVKTHLYRFEELRTRSNFGYALKTFYLQYDSNGRILWGENEDKLSHGPGPRLLPKHPSAQTPPPRVPASLISGQQTAGEQDPGLQGPHIQVPEIKGPDIQVPELQDPEKKVPGRPVPEIQGPGEKDPEVPVPEIQGPGRKDPGLQGPEIQNPGEKNPGIQDPHSPGDPPAPPSVPTPDDSGPPPDPHGPFEIGTRKGRLIAISNEPIVFHTLATDGTDHMQNKILERSERTRVVDRITFDKLSVGKSYRFIGTLIHKRTGKKVDTIEPILYETGVLRESHGTADVIFTFDATRFRNGDKFVITYEIEENGIVVASEKDLNNEAQTFKIWKHRTPPPKQDIPPKPFEPEDPPKPKDPPKPPVPRFEIPPVRIPRAGV